MRELLLLLLPLSRLLLLLRLLAAAPLALLAVALALALALPRARRLGQQRDADVRRLERADVVRAVADHQRRVAGVAQRVQHELFLLGAHAREDLHERDQARGGARRLGVRERVAGDAEVVV